MLQRQEGLLFKAMDFVENLTASFQLIMDVGSVADVDMDIGLVRLIGIIPVQLGGVSTMFVGVVYRGQRSIFGRSMRKMRLKVQKN